MTPDQQQPSEPLSAWDAAMQAHEDSLVVGTRVQLVEAECNIGSRQPVGLTGRIIRICRQSGAHIDPAVYPYVLENNRGHHGSHCFEVWVAGEPVTWWAAFGELLVIRDAEPGTQEAE